MGAFRAGTTCLVTKYIPPAVGYAETSSETVQKRVSRPHKTFAVDYLPEAERRQRAMATIQDDDERMLMRIGYKQVRINL